MAIHRRLRVNVGAVGRFGCSVSVPPPGSTDVLVPKRDDAGFSLLELIVALAVLALVLVGSEVVLGKSVGAVSVGNEYAVATALLKADMAEAVALPFADLQNGLNQYATCGSPAINCLGSDPNLVKSGSTYELDINGVVEPTASSIVPVNNTNTSESPIVPEITQVTPQPGIGYTVRTYPTLSSTCTPATESCVVTLVVIVTWTGPTGADRVVGEEGIATP